MLLKGLILDMEVKICLAANVEEALKGLQSYLGGMEFHQLQDDMADVWIDGFKEGYLKAVEIMTKFLEIEG